MQRADLSQSMPNLWGRSVMDYIKYYSNIAKPDKEKLIGNLNQDKVIFKFEILCQEFHCSNGNHI